MSSAQRKNGVSGKEGLEKPDPKAARVLVLSDKRPLKKPLTKKGAKEIDSSGEDSNADSSTPQVKPVSDNIVVNAIRDLTSLYEQMEEHRVELRARGIQGQATNVMVEMAFHKRKDQMQGLMEAALQSSRQAFGLGAITREELEVKIDSMLEIEKDIAHTRKLCKQRGLNLPVINFLTQLIRQNPGDGGQKAVNTFLGYASACNIELSGIDEITQKYTTEPESVLPVIEQETEDDKRALTRSVMIDLLIGLSLTIALMALVS